MASAFVDAQVAHGSAELTRLPGAALPWLARVRREALAAFAADGLPTSRDEHWKYTALKSLEQRSLGVGDPAASARAVEESWVALDHLDGPRLVFVNGRFRADLSRLDPLPFGARWQPLSEALARDVGGIEFALARAYHGRSEGFARLNTALAGDGAVLRLEAGVVVEVPVHLVFVGAAAEADLAWHARNLIDLGRGARLAVVEHHVGSGSHRQLGNLVQQWRLAPGARLVHVRLQDEASEATLVSRTEALLADDARLETTQLELGAGLSRADLDIDLAGRGATARVRGVAALAGRQHADQRVSIVHRGRDSASDTLWRAVAGGRSREVFAGRIEVLAGADGSDAQLSSKNLLLSAHAEVDTRPVLEIHADEVKASHGATVGQLDERSLFYLRSRGIDAGDARALLTRAFCSVALDDVADPSLREALAERLVAHLPRAAAEPST